MAASALRRIAPLLVALALFARLLVPAGFMPSADGRPGLVICTGQGAMTMPMAAIPDDRRAPRNDSGHQDDHVCPFAAMAMAAATLSPAASVMMPFRLFDVAHDADPVAPRPGLGLAAPPPPKTGPPLLR